LGMMGFEGDGIGTILGVENAKYSRFYSDLL